jgi:hypothetical protein
VGGARDRDLVVVQLVVAVDERDRLDRLRRRAQVADERRVSGGLAVGRDRVHAVDGLDDAVAAHLDADRLAHWSGSAICDVARV